MNIETKSFDIKADVVETSPVGTVHAIVAVFKNEDSVRDVMVKGAFAKSIKAGKAKGSLPPGVWSHDWTRPIAKTIDAFETDEGLNVIGQFNLETQDGRDAYSNVKNGLFTEYSFGFQRVDEEEKDGVTYVKSVNWFEWSPVLVGCNRETYTVGVKQYAVGDIGAEEEIETYLRDVRGFSQKASKIVISGIKALYQRDVEEARTPEPEAKAPKPEIEPEPKPEEQQTEEIIEAKTEAEPIIEVPPPVVIDLSQAVVQAKTQALYANFQQTKVRYGLR